MKFQNITALSRQIKAPQKMKDNPFVAVIEHLYKDKTSETAWLVMEKGVMDVLEMVHYIAKGRILSPNSDRQFDQIEHFIIMEMINAVKSCESHNIRHRDIKLENFVLYYDKDKHPRLKLSVFSMYNLPLRPLHNLPLRPLHNLFVRPLFIIFSR